MADPVCIAGADVLKSGAVCRKEQRGLAAEHAEGKKIEEQDAGRRRTFILAAGLLFAAAAALPPVFDALAGGQGIAMLQHHQAGLLALQHAYPLAATGAFFCLFVAVSALALPGASVLMLLAGAVHGLLAGTLICVTASTVGATLAMLASRHLLRDAVSRRSGGRLAAIEAGIEREGAWYLFGLRMAPVVPYVLTNLLFGLTRMSTRTYFVASFAGMLAGTAAYVHAGRELGRLGSAADIVSPAMLGALALVGMLPLASRWMLAARRRTSAVRA